MPTAKVTPKKTTKTAQKTSRRRRAKVNPAYARKLVKQAFSKDMHAARVLSLGNGVIGVLHAAVLAIHAIGQAYAKVANIQPKSGVKQIDRLLSNAGIVMEHVLKAWVAFVVGARKEIVVALDWTDFEKDDHATLAAYLVTRHGRSTPLVWRTVTKSSLEGMQKAYEYALIEQLHGYLDATIEVTLLADRGFGDQKLYDYLALLGWDFVIRFRGCIVVESAAGEAKPAKDWVPTNGRARMLPNARVTKDRFLVPAVVVVHAKKMQEAWCLATTLVEKRPSEVVKLYGKRFTIEIYHAWCTPSELPYISGRPGEIDPFAPAGRGRRGRGRTLSQVDAAFGCPFGRRATECSGPMAGSSGSGKNGYERWEAGRAQRVLGATRSARRRWSSAASA